MEPGLLTGSLALDIALVLPSQTVPLNGDVIWRFTEPVMPDVKGAGPTRRFASSRRPPPSPASDVAHGQSSSPFTSASKNANSAVKNGIENTKTSEVLTAR